MSLRCSKVGLYCILAVLPALTQPLPNLHHLVQTEVLEVPVRTSLMRRGPLRERFPIARAGTCGGMLLKAFAPSYERMVQPSSKPSVAVNAIISTPPETATPYWPQGWK